LKRSWFWRRWIYSARWMSRSLVGCNTSWIPSWTSSTQCRASGSRSARRSSRGAPRTNARAGRRRSIASSSSSIRKRPLENWGRYEILKRVDHPTKAKYQLSLLIFSERQNKLIGTA
jgi:hypothetical protein